MLTVIQVQVLPDVIYANPQLWIWQSGKQPADNIQSKYKDDADMIEISDF